MSVVQTNYVSRSGNNSYTSHREPLFESRPPFDASAISYTRSDMLDLLLFKTWCKTGYVASSILHCCGYIYFGGMTNVDFGVFPAIFPSNDPCRTLEDFGNVSVIIGLSVSNSRSVLKEGGRILVAGLLFSWMPFSLCSLLFSYNTYLMPSILAFPLYLSPLAADVRNHKHWHCQPRPREWHQRGAWARAACSERE